MTRINTNVPSLVAQNRLSRSNNDLQTAMTRLSTGLKINSGSDDPAGLIASEALRSEVTSLNKAIGNTQRASQIIATADSALGQVSNLLNDVRGLVVEAANSGALSEDEIAANQLQIDSSLEAINRISQTTTFQGRKLLDGSLDFLTQAGSNYDQIKSLQIDQANLGPAGKLGVSVSITKAAEQASVTVGDIPEAATNAASEGTIDFSRDIAGVKATGGIEFKEVSVAAAQATNSYTVANAATTGFDITAKADGAYAEAAGNSATFEIVQNGAQTDDIDIIKSGDDFTISIKTGATVTLDDVKAAFDADADTKDDFTFTVTGGGAVSVSGGTNTTAQAALAGGVDEVATTAAISLTAVADGTTANGATISFVEENGVTTPTATVDDDGNITVTVENSDTVAFADIKAAIDAEGTYTATVDTSGGLTSYDGDTATATTTAFSGGIDAETASAQIKLTALATGAAANGRTITFAQADGVTTPTAAVDGSGNITITVEDTDAVSLDDIVAAIEDEGTYAAEADVTGGLTSFDGDTDTVSTTDFAGGSTVGGATASSGSVSLSRTITAAKAAGAVDFKEISVAAAQGTQSYTVANAATAAFDITAKSDGDYAEAAGNSATFELVQNAAQTDDIDIIKSGHDFTISIKTGATVTLDDVKAAFEADNDVKDNFDFTITAGGTDSVSGATNAVAQAALAGGVDEVATTAAISLTAVADGAAANGATITFSEVHGVTTPTATVDADGNITITVENSDVVAFDDIKAAIDAEGTYSATVDTTGGLASYDGDTATATTTAFSGGVDGEVLTAEIDLTASETGEAINGKTITFAKVDGVTTPTATVDDDGNITISVEDTDAVSVEAIAAAIRTEGTYGAEARTTGGLTSFDGDTDVATVANFAGGAASSGGLAKDVVFELQGRTGSEVFNVSAGTGVEDLVTQINLVKDATGVTATVEDGSLVLKSNEYGSDAFVDLRIIEEETGGTFTAAVGAGSRDIGSDIEAKVNGVDANGKGNKLSINTSTLDLSIEVEAGSAESMDFTIAGGGALFQLGGDVVSNQQARVGIGSVNTARLGGVSGKLFQLGSGESAALANDPNAAAKIVNEAINQVTSLRGRLGAFQSTTLESNLVSLNDTVANLQEAESSIRDADFAAESARMTRAQILVQSGTNVLAMANQNPQSVLSLLR
ncbi:flagellin N-terminal helical domain-containing protein [Candidatus Laterigemmans baculatus]|uniref:flagellin N-terminal helical domain-containing protein n=1 Tax=Candidatus Laterigemmans baculatus TaxID=2770505 RepID=UPI001F211B08|nr:flagellin [Candidatus Laterigemmans baculatus]